MGGAGKDLNPYLTFSLRPNLWYIRGAKPLRELGDSTVVSGPLFRRRNSHLIFSEMGKRTRPNYGRTENHHR